MSERGVIVEFDFAAMDGAGLLFVPGGTVADRAKITNGTKRILHIIFTKGEDRHEELGN